MKIKPRRSLPGILRVGGHNTTIHNATEWAEEQEETAKYVKLICQSLMNGGSITEPTLGILADVRAGSTWSPEDAAIQNKKLTQEHEAKMKKWRLDKEQEEKQRLIQQEQRLAQREAERSERKKREREMKSYHGRWSKQDKLSDGTTMLLFHRDLEEPTTGLYIRVQGLRVDAGVFKDAGHHMNDACFMRFWGKRFRNGENAMKFVMWRAMGVKWEQRVNKESC